MAATFARWDLDPGNLVNAYDTEAAALAVVRRSIREHGQESVHGLALARETAWSTRNIARGDALVEPALAAEPPTPARNVVPG